MKLSTKGRYAMVALADLALAEKASGGEDLTSLAAISKRQDISLPYLEQLFVKLRRAGLVEAVRGPGGGYRLSRSPDAIRISEIMEAVEETIGAKAFSRTCSLAPSFAAVQYFSRWSLSRDPDTQWLFQRHWPPDAQLPKPPVHQYCLD